MCNYLLNIFIIIYIIKYLFKNDLLLFTIIYSKFFLLLLFILFNIISLIKRNDK